MVPLPCWLEVAALPKQPTHKALSKLLGALDCPLSNGRLLGSFSRNTTLLLHCKESLTNWRGFATVRKISQISR